MSRGIPHHLWRRSSEQACRFTLYRMKTAYADHGGSEKINPDVQPGNGRLTLNLCVRPPYDALLNAKLHV